MESLIRSNQYRINIILGILGIILVLNVALVFYVRYEVKLAETMVQDTVKRVFYFVTERMTGIPPIIMDSGIDHTVNAIQNLGGYWNELVKDKQIIGNIKHLWQQFTPSTDDDEMCPISES